MIIKILSFIGNSMSDSRISEKILSEVCGHDIWNLNAVSIGNFGEFAICWLCHSEASETKPKNLEVYLFILDSSLTLRMTR